MASFHVQAVTVFALLCYISGSSAVKGPCVYQDYLRIAQCYQSWGYDFSVVPHPDAVVWNMTALVSFCKTPQRQSISGCLRNGFSRCQFSEWEEETEALLRLSDLSDLAVSYICSNVDVIEDNRRCIESADFGMTKCVRDASNEAETEYMDIMLSDGLLTWEQVKEIKKRQALKLASCVEQLMLEKCNRKVALLFTNFFFSGYTVYANEP